MKVWNKNDPDLPVDAIYIGRGTPYGNPFKIGIDGTRDEVCDKFEKEILPTLDITPLSGKHMYCSCKPKRCHGDSILEKFRADVLQKFLTKEK